MEENHSNDSIRMRVQTQTLLGLNCADIIAGVVIILVFNYTFPKEAVVLTLWAFLSVLFSLICVHLHILYLRNLMSTWYSESILKEVQLLGFIVFDVSLAFVVWYGFCHVYYLQGPSPDFTTMNCLWAFMNARIGITLERTAKMYSNRLRGSPLRISESQSLTAEE